MFVNVRPVVRHKGKRLDLVAGTFKNVSLILVEFVKCQKNITKNINILLKIKIDISRYLYNFAKNLL